MSAFAVAIGGKADTESPTAPSANQDTAPLNKNPSPVFTLNRLTPLRLHPMLCPYC